MPTRLKKKAIDVLPHFHRVKRGDRYIEVALRTWDERGKHVFLCLDDHTSYRALPDEEVEVEEYELEELGTYYKANMESILEKDRLKMHRREDLRKVKVLIEFERAGLLGSCVGCPSYVVMSHGNECTTYYKGLKGSERPEWCHMEEVPKDNPFM